MAWNQPGKGNQNPWRGKDTGGVLDGLLQRLRELFGVGGGNPLGWLIPLIVILMLFNSFKLIDERERGVVLRFGKFNRIMMPGANFKLPWPVETAYVVDSTKVETLEDTVRVLTKDENIVDIKLNAQYAVSDPRLYLFGFRDDLVGDNPQGAETMRHAAESAVREVVGNNSMDTVLFNRDQLVIAARVHLQESLDLYKTGLKVTQFNLQDARPPDEVKKAFDAAISAREKKNSIINEAKAYASKIVPEARGVAARIKAESQGYQAATIAKATGDAARFRLLADQYRKAPEVTRKRLYLETMQLVLAKNQKVISGRGNNILYLPINTPGAGATQGADAPVMQLPATQVAPVMADPGSNDAASNDGRDARAGGR